MLQQQYTCCPSCHVKQYSVVQLTFLFPGKGEKRSKFLFFSESYKDVMNQFVVTYKGNIQKVIKTMSKRCHLELQRDVKTEKRYHRLCINTTITVISHEGEYDHTIH